MEYLPDFVVVLVKRNKGDSQRLKCPLNQEIGPFSCSLQHFVPFDHETFVRAMPHLAHLIPDNDVEDKTFALDGG